MHILTWIIVAIAMTAWPLGVVRTFSSIRERMRNEQEVVAARESAAFAWSEKRLLEIMKLYPYSATPAYTYAQSAHRRKEWEEALRRYEVAIKIDRKDERGYAGAAAALRGLGRLDESDAMLHQAEKRCRTTRNLPSEFGYNAFVRKDWEAAARYWAQHRQIFPDDRTGYRHNITALRRMGREDEAEALATEVRSRFREQIAAEAVTP